ncbi:hypothetical protein P3S68_033646 [Capsicum galapagoense]
MENLKRVFVFAIFCIILANFIEANIVESKLSCHALCRLACLSSPQPAVCNSECEKRCKIHSVYEAMIHNTSCYERCSIITDKKKLEGCFDDCTTKYYKVKRSIIN